MGELWLLQELKKLLRLSVNSSLNLHTFFVSSSCHLAVNKLLISCCLAVVNLTIFLQTVSHCILMSLKFFVLLENSNLVSKLRRLSRFLRLRRTRRSQWRQGLIRIKRTEARTMTMRISFGGPRAQRVTSP